jgi:ankyrin repeat protein
MSTGTFGSTNSTHETISLQEIVEASLYGKTNTIDNALAQGFKPDTLDPDNRTALMFAAFNGQAAIVKKLIAAGADVNLQDTTGTSALMFAASGPDTETVQLLIAAGAQVNMVDNNEHFSALMWAAAEGKADNLKLLLKHGADASLQDIDGDTAESFAAKKGFKEIVKILQDASAKKDSTKGDTE